MKTAAAILASMVWTPPQDAALAADYRRGLSCAQIAMRINTQFGTTYTRNSVIGRASRIGLPGTRPVAEKRSPAPRKRDYAAVARDIAAAKRPAPKPNIETVALLCAEVTPLNMDILDLGKGHCRYPYGDRVPYRFCGHLAIEGSSYCAPHFHLCRNPRFDR